MAHIFSDNNEDKRIPFYFTIGVAVGKGHAGAPHEDVALVRWMLRNCYSPSMQSESAKACNALAPVGGCDQPLIDAITAVQRLNFPSNMDGYVSPMKDTKTIRMMHLLNAGVRRIHFPYWPLLQNVPNLYPPIMKSIFHDCVVGTSDPLPMPLK